MYVFDLEQLLSHQRSLIEGSHGRIDEGVVSKEVLGLDQLEDLGRWLGTALKVRLYPSSKVKARFDLARTAKELRAAHEVINASANGPVPLSPGADWLLDNYHIIRAQQAEIAHNLPRKFYQGLPRVTGGPYYGYPRVYVLALSYIAATDNHVDPVTLRAFVHAFQQTTPLTIGELWALSLSLRIMLIETLRPLAVRIARSVDARARAEELTDQLLELRGKAPSPEALVEILQRHVAPADEVDRVFLVHLLQRLRDQDPDLWPANEWIYRKLRDSKVDPDRLIQTELNLQTAAQITIGNAITSLRLLSSMIWREFFESVSAVDAILRQDPRGVYERMEFASRDVYRHAVERLARNANVTERAVAEAARDLARAAQTRDPDDQKRSHVGQYLIGREKHALSASIRYRHSVRDRLYEMFRRSPSAAYLGLGAFFTTLTLVGVAAIYVRVQGGHWLAALALGALVLLPASEFVIGLLNHFLTIFLRPTHIAKMDFERGLPASARTFVVVPALIGNFRAVDELLKNLEQHYLGNADPQLRFAVLGDFADSATETCDGDEDLVRAALEGVEKLNRKWCPGGAPLFHYFHRARLWNPVESKWMGWERKRGKLEEFNRLLRGARDTSYTVATADTQTLREAQFVLTLDADTQLARDTARRLLGAIMHPLNRAEFDPGSQRVTAGFGLIQPRVAVSLTSSLQTRFTGVFAGVTGIDSYTTAVSDVYQDLFDEGIFTGKGLYHIDTFVRAVGHRVPENALLSHDLFEGSYLRVGLASDVELYDDFPESFTVYARRLHRWIRGDWQLLGWLAGRVLDARRRRVPNDLSLAARWKIFDNLRRSLVPSATLIWLLLSWTLLPGSPWVWTLVIVALVLAPIYASLSAGFFSPGGGATWSGHFRYFRGQTTRALTQLTLMLTHLVELSVTQLDAIGRTLFRIFISRRNLLEWTTFAQDQSRAARSGLSGPALSSLAVALLAMMAAAACKPGAEWVALPFCLAWSAGPWLGLWMGGKVNRQEISLSAGEVTQVREYARRTWSYFENYVRDDGHWLAPDNFQNDPSPVVAYRTSPTNMGLQLLSAAAAYDLGFLGPYGYLEYAEKSFATFAKLKRLRGHFYNWYDTRTLEPLRPEYVSTVDSGNFAGHLLAFRQSLERQFSAPADTARLREGLNDTLGLLHLELRPLLRHYSESSSSNLQILRQKIAAFTEQVAQPNTDWERADENLADAEGLIDVVQSELGSTGDDERVGSARQWLRSLRAGVAELRRGQTPPEKLSGRVERIASEVERLVREMDFKFLFDDKRKLFTIGYNVAEDRRDASYYDLLASEARLTSAVAIAKGDISQQHWFHLGRRMNTRSKNRALLSWSGTMFEYLMPLLVMRRYPRTLLDETYDSVLNLQIRYGRRKKLPWGISEAGYNARDLHFNYQYGPFGVPGLGMARGLADNYVISPYSSMLGLMVRPQESLRNLQELRALGALGDHGFFESLDFTAARLPPDQTYFVLKSYMAHHQGMSLVAMANVLTRFAFQRDFHRDPRVRATELLLQEKVPRYTRALEPNGEAVRGTSSPQVLAEGNLRSYRNPHMQGIRTHILSNGYFSTLVTATGSGYCKAGNLMLNRWRPDPTLDNWGSYIYVRRTGSSDFWSTAFQPSAREPTEYEVVFSEDQVRFNRRDGDIQTMTEILVAPEDNVELRRVTLTNHGSADATMELTSYSEVTLARYEDDRAHPAFSNLFVQTEYDARLHALFATRRPRKASEKPPYVFHMLNAEPGESIRAQYETDRARFLGRGRSARDPAAMDGQRPLSNTTGSVLDPVFSLRKTVTVPAGRSVRVTFCTGIAANREDALQLAGRYHEPHSFVREAEFAWTKSRIQLRHLNVSAPQAHTFQRLGAGLLYPVASLRAPPKILELNQKTQAGLWAYGISGDLPIVLASLREVKDVLFVRELLMAHEYLGLKGLQFDLVILNEKSHGYMQEVHDEVQRQILVLGFSRLVNQRGGIFSLRAALLPEEDINLLRGVARVQLNPDGGPLQAQLKRGSKSRAAVAASPRFGADDRASGPAPALESRRAQLEFFNGLGGFADGGREYEIELQEGLTTPAPWINVIANETGFGFTISESGSSYTWSQNSRENRLSPWSNDPVGDASGEMFFLRDEVSGESWSPLPADLAQRGSYRVRHGQGYTAFDHQRGGIAHTVEMSVARHDEVKVVRLRLRNLTNRARTLSVTSYVEWVLGFHVDQATHVVTEYDEATQLCTARNPYNNEFAGRVAFHFCGSPVSSFTCDRTQFLGRNANPKRPAALRELNLGAAQGAGLDPCAALRAPLHLPAQGEVEISFYLGQAATREAVDALLLRYRAPNSAAAIVESSKEFWEETLGRVQVRTPDPALNLLLNRWLVYQTLSCRVWARSALYQSGGAYGFRDQLQDVMALVYANPSIAREQILRAAARQFAEGDVQHWWHPPTGRGVRTRFSDDLLWLPFVISHYVDVTGDRAILDEMMPYLDAPELQAGVDDLYFEPASTRQSYSLFDHAQRAIDRSLRFGAHGLPLMGSGDWNDGMSHVGNEGRGESVWVAWFQLRILRQWSELARERGAHEAVLRFEENEKRIKEAVESAGWDGDWYRRAYFDDGTPLGSAANEECRIDSIAQSWAVLSGAGDRTRSERAMGAVDQYLVDRGDGLIKLFVPPFDKGTLNPGYIKGYVPGVRENGGQYTHAAIWAVMAFAELGQVDLAHELYQILNPITHSATRAGMHKYKVEPYVAAADVYGMAPHVGRGGWTWYTGSASWMYRAGLEKLLGFELRANQLRITADLPAAWSSAEIVLRWGASRYTMQLTGHGPQRRIFLDDREVAGDGNAALTLIDDQREHVVRVERFAP